MCELMVLMILKCITVFEWALSRWVHVFENSKSADDVQCTFEQGFLILMCPKKM